MAYVLRSLYVVLLATSLTIHGSMASTASAAQSPESSSFYLDSANIDVPQLRYFEALFTSSAVPTYEQVRKEINNMILDPSLVRFQENYRTGFLKAMGIGDVFEWIESNPKIFFGINAYVDDPGNGDEPLWQSTNRKLRSGEMLSKDELKFKKDLLNSLSQLPSYRGIVFRGAALTVARLESYLKGKTVKDPAFVSTSIDPRIAVKFSKSEAEDRVSVLFIIKVREGTPVSVFHAFHWEEYEILLRNNQSFKVHQAIYDGPGRNAVIVMEQI